MRIYNEFQVRKALKRECNRMGGQLQFAERHDFSEQYICDVIRGFRSPAPRICRALGFHRITRYVRVRGD
jgi:hypothetical protein